MQSLVHHTHTHKRLSCSLCFLQTPFLLCSYWTTFLFDIRRRRKFSSLIRFSYFLLMPSIYIYQNHLQLTCNANTSTTSFHFPIFTIPYVALHITLSISYLILPYAKISKRLLCDLLFTVACDNGLREEQFRL